MNLTTMLESTCRKFPDKEAVVYGAERITYRELLAASRRAAEVFRARDVASGDRVAVMTFNTPGFVIAAFGAWRAGAAVVPVNHKLAAPEVEYLLRHSGATGWASYRPSCDRWWKPVRRRSTGCSPRVGRTPNGTSTRSSTSPKSGTASSWTRPTSPRCYRIGDHRRPQGLSALAPLDLRRPAVHRGRPGARPRRAVAARDADLARLPG